MNRKIEKILDEYVVSLGKPQLYWRKDRFRQVSYAIWAVEELKKYLILHTEIDTISAIENFLKLMDVYSCAYNKGAHYPFCVAYDTIMDIYDLYI